MKGLELRAKTADELREMLGKSLLRQEELTMMLRQKKVKNVKELGFVKRDIARIKSVLHEKNV